MRKKELYEINEGGEFLHKAELITKKEAELKESYTFVDKKKKECRDADQARSVHGHLSSGIGINHKPKRI